MKQRHAKEMWPLIKAWAEGKTIQYRPAGTPNWIDADDLSFSDSPECYRIKPEVVKYRRSLIRHRDELRVVVWYPSDGMDALREHSTSGSFIRWLDTDWVEETI